MNNLKMLLEEILPYYFFLMLPVLVLTSYTPTRFELYIVYAFAFGVAVYNNVLYKASVNNDLWKDEALRIINVYDEENKNLKLTIQEMAHEMELMEDEINSVTLCGFDDEEEDEVRGV